ncbi:MAG: hypothetical protein OXI08_04825, partial [Cyanobacteria bacterium MAG IRC4_bin_6]|nr:hypothetical protein [Cyanobacteria bacterium MAG IRC4_bin_6]
MRVGPWRRWGRLLSSRSEASCSSSTVRFRLGSPLLPLLLGLPLVAGLGPTRAQAQVACTTANSDGSYDVPADWSLKPSGLASGARFRLLFVTSTTRDATATDIATYNTFVQDRAKAGHSAVTDSCGDLFKVVGSTLAVNARANTDSESTDTDAAIYWLNGAKAADNYADFYDGNWDSVAAKNESGNNPPSSVTFVWTGSGSDGVTAAGYLGRADNNVIRGRLDTNQPLSEGAIYYTTTQPFYGLSPVFKVDSGTPTLTISGPAAADEGDGDPMQRLFTVGLSSAVTGKVSYQVCFSGTAKLGSGSGSLVQDYRMESNGATVSNEEGCLSGLELAAGETGSGQDVGIAVLGDLFPEGDETVVATLSLEAAPEGVVLGTNMATHTIRNDDGSKATLTLPGATTSLVEGDGPAEFVLSGSGVTSGSSYYVQFGLGGTATNRTDYRIEVRLDGQWYDVTGTASSVWLDVGADVLPLRLRLVPLADERVEGEESAVLTLAAGEGYTSGTPSSVTFDVGERTVAVAAAAAVTEGEAAGFTLTASPAPKEDLPVTVQVRDSGDFASGGTGARTVTVGTTGTASFSVATTDDDTDEPNGTITATVNAGTGYAPHSTEGSASVTVNDNDVAPTVFWEFRGGGIAENSGTYTREAIQANRDLGSALTVNYSLSGTATCGTDYMITGADCTTGTGAFTLPANTTAFTGVPFPVTITPDDISDNGETIIVTLTAGNGYNISGEVSTFTIYDDTGTAAFSLSGRPQVGETLSIVKDSDDPDGNGSRSFNYVWQFRATSSDDWSDLAASQRGCGDTTTCTPTHSEEYPAVGGYFRGRASYVDGNGLGTGAYTNAVGPFTLPAPGIALPTADLALREGATASYNLKLATDPGDGATVRVSVTSGDTGAVTVNDTQSGVNGVQNYLDFTGGSGGSWNTHQAVAVAGVQDVDATSEADVALIHAVSVQAGASAPYTGLADRILNVDVRDDDAPNSAPAFASGTLTRSVAENAAAGANVGAAIPAATDRDGDALTYTLGGADADSFQFDGATRQITTREGVTYDNEVKSVYRVTVTAADNNGGRATVRVTITVLDAEELVASFGSATSSAGEDGGTQNVQVNLSPSPQVGMTLGYEVSGTATAGSDFSIANSGSVQVDANTASVTIPVTITEDTEAEEAETVILTLTGGSGYRVGSGNVHTLTINDNDDPGPATPVVSIGVSPSSMTEGETATFTLTASPAPTEDISVTVQVMDSGDFASGGTGPRTVTIPPSGTAVFTVVTTDDHTDEPNGTITVTVNTGTGYAPHNTEGSASVTVNDNDGADGDGDGGGNDGNNNDGAGGDNDGADGADGATSPPVVPPTVGISRGRAVITEGDHAVFTL